VFAFLTFFSSKIFVKNFRIWVPPRVPFAYKPHRVKTMDGVLATAEAAQMRGNIAVIKIRGYLDLNTADSLDDVIESLLESECFDIIVDLSEVKYIGSRGWGVFSGKIKRIREQGGDLKLALMNPGVYEVYKVLEFFWFLRSYDTLEDAVSDFENDIPPMP
jgi:anti-sigma B factor antagonist